VPSPDELLHGGWVKLIGTLSSTRCWMTIFMKAGLVPFDDETCQKQVQPQLPLFNVTIVRKGQTLLVSSADRSIKFKPTDAISSDSWEVQLRTVAVAAVFDDNVSSSLGWLHRNVGDNWGQQETQRHLVSSPLEGTEEEYYTSSALTPASISLGVLHELTDPDEPGVVRRGELRESAQSHYTSVTDMSDGPGSLRNTEKGPVDDRTSVRTLGFRASAQRPGSRASLLSLNAGSMTSFPLHQSSRGSLAIGENRASLRNYQRNSTASEFSLSSRSLAGQASRDSLRKHPPLEGRRPYDIRRPQSLKSLDESSKSSSTSARSSCTTGNSKPRLVHPDETVESHAGPRRSTFRLNKCGATTPRGSMSLSGTTRMSWALRNAFAKIPSAVETLWAGTSAQKQREKKARAARARFQKAIDLVVLSLDMHGRLDLDPLTRRNFVTRAHAASEVGCNDDFRPSRIFGLRSSRPFSASIDESLPQGLGALPDAGERKASWLPGLPVFPNPESQTDCSPPAVCDSRAQKAPQDERCGSFPALPVRGRSDGETVSDQLEDQARAARFSLPATAGPTRGRKDVTTQTGKSQFGVYVKFRSSSPLNRSGESCESSSPPTSPRPVFSMISSLGASESSCGGAAIAMLPARLGSNERTSSLNSRSSKLSYDPRRFRSESALSIGSPSSPRRSRTSWGVALVKPRNRGSSGAEEYIDLCTLCSQPIKASFSPRGLRRLSFQLDGTPWRTAFGEPNPLFYTIVEQLGLVTPLGGGLTHKDANLKRSARELEAQRCEVRERQVEWETSFAAKHGRKADDEDRMSSAMFCRHESKLQQIKELQQINKYFVRLRVFLAVIWLCCLIWGIADWPTRAKSFYLIKMSHWSNIMLECYLVFAAVCTYLAIYSDIPDGTHEATPWFVRVAWFLQTIALSSSIYITVVRLVDPNGVTGGGGYWTHYGVVAATHGVNTILALLDYVVCFRMPQYLVHTFAPMSFEVIYQIFAFLYYILGGKGDDGVSSYIYRPMDFSSIPLQVMLYELLSFDFFMVPFVYIIIYLIYLMVRTCRIVGEIGDDIERRERLKEGRRFAISVKDLSLSKNSWEKTPRSSISPNSASFSETADESFLQRRSFVVSALGLDVDDPTPRKSSLQSRCSTRRVSHDGMLELV